jgi:hypothetical protein
MTEEDFIRLHGRGRVVVDIALWQKKSVGEPPELKGILLSTVGGSAVIHTQRGTRRFNLVDGFENGSQARGGGMRIVDLEQLKAQPVDAD